VSSGNKTYELHLKAKNCNEEELSSISVRQIIRQKPAKASVVRQPKKVYGKMIGMGVKSSTILIAVTADFFCDSWAAEVPSDECIRDIPGGVHNHQTLDWNLSRISVLEAEAVPPSCIP
jgi:hypothetical protein